MKSATAQKISNALLSCAAGFASFIFSLAALLYVTELDEKVLAALTAGVFCLLISYIAAERPNSDNARAMAALRDRLLAVGEGDLISPTPPIVARVLPKLASAVDVLFSEVRASIENAHALGLYDPVTSLPNRLHFRAEVDKLLGAVPEDALSAMMFVDLGTEMEPLGAPVHLILDRADANGLWVAQDTGGAIKGPNRFDTFWGAGEAAVAAAGGLAASGSALLLIPKSSASRALAQR